MSRLIEEVKRGEGEFQCGGRHSAAPLRLSAEHRIKTEPGRGAEHCESDPGSEPVQEVPLLGGEGPASVCLFVCRR